MALSLLFKKRFNGFVLLFGVLLILSPLSENAFSAPDTLDQKLESLVESFMTKTRDPAVSVLVAEKGKIIFQKSYGLANIEHDIQATNDTAFPIGSMTKQFTGLAIHQLISAGKLSLDDRLLKFFPNYPNGEKITVRNLLNHTSGITNYVHKKEFKERVWEKQSPEEMLAWFKDDPLLFEPGTRWNYTNSGTYLLGVIVEKVSNVSYAEYLKDNIFKPFGMDRTYVAGSRDIIPNRASGYDSTAEGYKNARAYDASGPFSAGAIISTTGDVWKFLNNVHRMDSISEDIRRLIYQQETLPNGEKTVYTLGGLFKGNLDGHLVYSHPGSVYGFSSDEAYYPDDDIIVIALTNGNQGPASLTQKISRAVLGIEQPKYGHEKITKAEMARLTGAYQFTAQIFVESDKAAVSFKGDMLMLSMGNSKESMFTLPFTYSGNGQYVMIADDEIILMVDDTVKSPKLILRYNYVDFNLRKITN